MLLISYFTTLLLLVFHPQNLAWAMVSAHNPHFPERYSEVSSYKLHNSLIGQIPQGWGLDPRLIAKTRRFEK